MYCHLKFKYIYRAHGDRYHIPICCSRLYIVVVLDNSSSYSYLHFIYLSLVKIAHNIYSCLVSMKIADKYVLLISLFPKFLHIYSILCFDRFGIRVNAVLPGFIETPMIESVPDHLLEISKMMIPLARLGKPEGRIFIIP